MLLYLLLVLIFVPLIELIVLIKIGQQIGALATVALVIAAGIGGTCLARRAGVKAFRAVQADLEAGRLPAESLLDGLIVLVAGILLITPGLMTDVLGLVLLIPPVRALLRRGIQSRLRHRMIVLHGGGVAGGSGAEWVDVEPHSAHDIETPWGELPPGGPPERL